jgi:membrane-bound metal-dependent hydrolase YbcI (DUF457 family)
MFIGHFGTGFGAKALAPRVSLGTLLLGALFLDLLWPTLLLVGAEQVRIAPGSTAVTPLAFEHYPISHSLLAVLGWAVLVAVVHFYLRRDRKGASILAALVLSHWLLDLVVHRPDLPVFPGDSLRLGLGAWASLPLTLAIEIPMFAIGIWLYARCTAASDSQGQWGLWALVAFLAVLYAGNVFGPPPPSVEAIAWAGELQWLLVLWGYWIDGHRHGRDNASTTERAR